MSQNYSYTVNVGGQCCYFGQVDKEIPQPGNRLLILKMCDALKVVTAKLKAGESAECGQVVAIDAASGLLTTDDTDLACLYGVVKEGVTGGAEPCPVTVYVTGGFDGDKLVSANHKVFGAEFAKAARGLGLYVEKRH